mgnify:FL=1
MSDIVEFKQDAAFHYHRGLKFELNNDWKSALNSFELAYDKEPDNELYRYTYTSMLSLNGLLEEAEKILFSYIIDGEDVEQYYQQLSEMYIQQHRPNDAFLFGLMYVQIADDDDYLNDMLEMYDVQYTSLYDILYEAEVYTTQYIFHHLFNQGKLKEAKEWLLIQNDEVMESRLIQNLLAMSYLFNEEYEEARTLLEHLLKIDQTDITALCHYTLLLYNLNETEAFENYLSTLKKIRPINDDQKLKLGVVLSFLKQYYDAYDLLFQIYKKKKSTNNLQLLIALMNSSYYIDKYDFSKKLYQYIQRQFKHYKVIGPWDYEADIHYVESIVQPLLHSEDSNDRLIGIFLLSHVKYRESLANPKYWTFTDQLTDREKLYLTHIFQQVQFKQVQPLHKGFQLIRAQFKVDDDFIEMAHIWIETIDDLNDIHQLTEKQLTALIGATIYHYYQSIGHKKTKKYICNEYNISLYALNKALDQLT